MKNILTILIFLFFLTSPLSVQYTQTGLQFQREVLGKELCEDDDEDCKRMKMRMRMVMMIKMMIVRKMMKRMTMTKIMVKVKTFHLLHQQPAKVQLK